MLENAMVCLLSFLWPLLLLLGEHKFLARATFNALSVCKGARPQFNPI